MLTFRTHGSGGYPPNSHFPGMYTDRKVRLPPGYAQDGVSKMVDRKAASTAILTERAQSFQSAHRQEQVAPGMPVEPPAITLQAPQHTPQPLALAAPRTRPWWLPSADPQHFALSDHEAYGSLSDPTMTESDLTPYHPIARPRRATMRDRAAAVQDRAAAAIEDHRPGSSTDRMALGNGRPAIGPIETALVQSKPAPEPTSQVIAPMPTKHRVSIVDRASEATNSVLAVASGATEGAKRRGRSLATKFKEAGEGLVNAVGPPMSFGADVVASAGKRAASAVGTLALEGAKASGVLAFEGAKASGKLAFEGAKASGKLVANHGPTIASLLYQAAEGTVKHVVVPAALGTINHVVVPGLHAAGSAGYEAGKMSLENGATVAEALGTGAKTVAQGVGRLGARAGSSFYFQLLKKLEDAHQHRMSQAALPNESYGPVRKRGASPPPRPDAPMMLGDAVREEAERSRRDPGFQRGRDEFQQHHKTKEEWLGTKMGRGQLGEQLIGRPGFLSTVGVEGTKILRRLNKNEIIALLLKVDGHA